MLGYDAILIIRLIQNSRASNPTYFLIIRLIQNLRAAIYNILNLYFVGWVR